MKTWFTSDTHFGHKNIIDYCKRPFRYVSRDVCLECCGTGTRPRTQKPIYMLVPCEHPCVEFMNQVLIANWNERVADDDLVYHLGDFAFGNAAQVTRFAKELKGRKVLVKGNHDRLKTRVYEGLGFQVRKSMILGSVRLQHHPPSYNDATPGIYLCGHVHEMWAKKTFATKPDVIIINVGVDVRGWKPVSAEELGVDPNLLVG